MGVYDIGLYFVGAGIIVSAIGFFFFFFFKKNKANAFESVLSVHQAKRPRFVYGGNGGVHYDAYVSQDPKVYGEFADIKLSDGTELKKLTIEELHFVKNWKMIIGENVFVCSRDGNNMPTDWDVPDRIRAYLKASKYNVERVREESENKIVDTANIVEKIRGMASPSPDSFKFRDTKKDASQ